MLYFDALRYSINIASNCHERILKQITDYTYNKDAEKFDYYELVSNSWTYIDHLSKIKIFCEKLNFKDPENILDSFSVCRFMRHTFQHLDERIEEIFISNNMFIWGTYTWVATRVPGKTYELYSAMPGALKTVPVPINLPIDSSSTVEQEILRFEVEGLIRFNKDKYEKRMFSFLDSFKVLKKISKSIEKSVENATKTLDPNTTFHSQDMTMMLTIEMP